MTNGDQSIRQFPSGVKPKLERGFTLIELLVVMAILATVLSLAAPSYFASIDRGKETALEANLQIVRDAIDRYYADNGQYPVELQALVQARYLRSVPDNPFSDTAEGWATIEHPAGLPGIYDLRSAIAGLAPSGGRLEAF